VVAELVHRCGAYGGSEGQMLSADQWNEQGYWEYLPLIAFNDDLLASVDASWLVPPSFEDEGHLSALVSQPDFRERALGLIAAMESVNGTPTSSWFWKDPRLGIVLPFWKEFWPGAIYLVLVRSPLDIALSLRARFHFPVSASLLMWQQYMLAILRHTAGSPNVLFIEYEQLVRDPLSQCARLSGFVNEHSGTFPTGSNSPAELARAVKSSLRHNNTSDDFAEAPFASTEQKALYNFLRKSVDDRAAKFDESAFGIYPGWREYLQTIGLLQEWWVRFQQLGSRFPDAEPPTISESSRRMLGV
jgi:hypothetical protein